MKSGMMKLEKKFNGKTLLLQIIKRKVDLYYQLTKFLVKKIKENQNILKLKEKKLNK